MGVHAARNLSYVAYRFLVGQDPARIMQICNHDQTRPRTDLSFHFFRREPKAVLEPARKPFYVRPEITSNCEQRFVGGMLNQYLVSRIYQCSHGEMVSEGGARSRDDAVSANSISRTQ